MSSRISAGRSRIFRFRTCVGLGKIDSLPMSESRLQSVKVQVTCSLSRLLSWRTSSVLLPLSWLDIASAPPKFSILPVDDEAGQLWQRYCTCTKDDTRWQENVILQNPIHQRDFRYSRLTSVHAKSTGQKPTLRPARPSNQISPTQSTQTNHMGLMTASEALGLLDENLDEFAIGIRS